MSRSKAIPAILLIAVMVLPSGFSSAAKEELFVRVGLSHGSGAVLSLELKSEEGFALTDISSGDHKEIQRFPAAGQLTVSLQSGLVTARDDSGTTLFEDSGKEICIIPLSGLFTYNNNQYRGGICFYKTGNGRMNVINYISLEEYLYGVLNSEMGYRSPPEALKAQAVTARSFTIGNLAKHDNEGFDLCTDVHCQVYRGHSDEYKETNSAIDETSGLVLTYGGKPVAAYYFKNSGGHTMSAEDVWGNKTDHLIGVKDEYSPNYPWSYSLTFGEAGAALKAAGHDIGTVGRAEITGRGPSGAVSAVRFTGSSGNIEIKSERIRTLFGMTNIRSRHFSFGSGGNTNSGTVYVMSANGKTEILNQSDAFVISANGVSKMTGYQAGEVTEAVTTGPIVFTGKGYGHGVGLPQDSAIEMAKQGFTYDEILLYFFTGVKIQ